MPLDLATTFTLSVIVHVMMGALLGLFWRSARRRQTAGMGWWVLNEAALAAGALLLMISTVSPARPILAAGNAAFVMGIPMLELGLRVWFGRRLWPGMAWRWGLAVLGFAAWWWSWSLGLDYAGRSVLFTGVNTLQALLFAQYLHSQLRDTADRPSRLALQLIGWGALLIIVMSLWRATQNWPYAGTGVPPPRHLLAVLMVVNIAVAVTRVSAMLLMLHGRVEARLQLASAELERRANVDALTEVASRAYFEAASEVLLMQARASRLPVCLMLCDMDAFKAVNDELGHPEGDALLQGFAEQLRGALRQGDLAGRMGGDEFAVLLFNCPLPAAQRISERLCQAVAGLRASDGRGVTLSAGLAQAAPGEDFAALYRRADQALYAAKAAGRNRVVALDSSP
ncbi:MAG: GGDEF domain-containing protein [Comamonadaceae bacterium]|jgi:diguanylate cyclase (GGDEF)-like protein|nr:GGDEF domain-containing protein [Comamonadaceae bacterium]